jgi:hypothetical protein
MQITIKLKGNRPLLCHNERLANPLDPHTRRLKELTGQRKKTDEIFAQISHFEQRGGYYETPDNLVGLPTRNLFAALKVAAKTLNLGKQIEKALRFDGDEIVPLTISGRTWPVEEHCDATHALEHSLMVGVRNQSSRIFRTRPKITNWESAHSFELDEGLLDERRLLQIAKIAGRDVGLCDWRPRYGTFDVTLSNGREVR